MKFERVYGIGLSRTGTTTLHDYLNTVGYNSVHFPNSIKRLEQVFDGTTWNAAVDTPIALNFRELYYRYPKAGFILTLRNKQKWLDSVEHHMSKGKGRRGHGHQFTRMIRKGLYGSIEFNRDIYAKAYNTHIQNVMNFFRAKDSISQLIMINIPDNAAESLDRLNNFLDIPEHKRPKAFEHLNKKTNVPSVAEAIVRLSTSLK